MVCDGREVKKMKSTEPFYPVYFIYGAESFLVDEEIRRLLEESLPGGRKDLNLHVFSGIVNRSQEVLQAARTIPMFSPLRFVLLEDAEQLGETDIKEFTAYLENPSSTTCLVIRAEEAGPWAKHLAKIEKIGRVMKFERLKGRGLVAWMKKRMEAKGKNLTEEAACFLEETVGDHLQDLDNVLEKAFLATGNGRTVQFQDVEDISDDVKLNTVFDLTDAVGHQDVDKALGILRKALSTHVISFRKEESSKHREDEVHSILLGSIARQYRLIWKVKEAGHENPPEEVGRVVGIRFPWIVKKLMDQAKRFSTSSLRAGLLKCHRTDLALKRGQGPKRILLETLVIDLCCPEGKAHR